MRRPKFEEAEVMTREKPQGYSGWKADKRKSRWQTLSIKDWKKQAEPGSLLLKTRWPCVPCDILVLVSSFLLTCQAKNIIKRFRFFSKSKQATTPC
jgi:hypothetical protein